METHDGEFVGEFEEGFVHDPEAFADFVMWKSLPVMLKRPPKNSRGEQLDVKAFLEQLAIDDAQIVKLAQIPSQAAFAKEYGITERTVERWSKKVLERDMVADARAWATTLLSNALFAIYNKVISGKASAQEASLFFQIGAGWSPKLRLETTTRKISKVIIEVVPSDVLIPADQAVTIEAYEQRPVYRLKRAGK